MNSINLNVNDLSSNIENLFPAEPSPKQDAFANLWAVIQNTLNIAVHNNVQQVSWSKEDSELMLLCTTATLGRLCT